MKTLELGMPALVNTYLRLKEPSYASLPNIMKAKKKTMEIVTSEDLGVDLTPRTKTIKVEAPAERKAGIMVASVEELVDKLKNEAKVIS